MLNLQNAFENNGFENKIVNLNRAKNESTNIDLEDTRKKRKISFKVKNISPKKNFSTTLSSNKVKELTLKFNELVNEKEPQIKKIVKRVNSKIEKPKIRPKPKIELRKKPSIKRKSSFRTKIDQKIDQKTSEHRHSVRKTIEIFENKSKTDINNKQNQRTSKIDKKKTDLYETLKLTKTTSSQQILKMAAENKMAVLPNNSFLWRQKSRENINLNIYSTIVYDDNVEKNKIYDDTGQKTDDTADNHQDLDDNLDDNLYDTVEPKPQDDIKNYEQILQKTDDILSEYRSSKYDIPPESIIKSDDTLSTHTYETYEENIYENPEKNDNIYEVLSSESSEHTTMGSSESSHPILNMSHPEIGVEVIETTENFKENIYSTISELNMSHPNLGEHNYQDDTPTHSPQPKMGVGLLNEAKTQSYESINDVIDNLNLNTGVGPKFGSNNGSNSGSNRDSIVSYDLQNSLYGKYSPTSLSSKSSHLDEWIDLSDPETENSGFIIVQNKQKLSKKASGWSNKVREQWTKNNSTIVDDDALSDSYHYYESLNSDEFDSFDSDSDIDSKTHQNDSGVEMGMANLPDLPKMGVTNQYGLTKLAQRLRKNWSLTKNDITKSLSRMTKKSPHKNSPSTPMGRPRAVSSPVLQKMEPLPDREGLLDKAANSNSMTRKKNWLKFRRSQSMAESNQSETEGNVLQVFNPNMSAKSTFYLIEDTSEDIENQKPQVPLRKKTQRPQIPPPPIPTKTRNTSWYLESGLFKNETGDSQKTSFWYTEIGLYENNSKNMTVDDEKNKKQILQKPDLIPNSIFYTNSETNDDITDAYYNMKNEKFSTLLKDEPLYQFYDAEIIENSLNISSSDSEYDGYETVGETLEIPQDQKNSLRNILKTGRTLWSELPEVMIAEVLPSMNQTQKKLQEAKFEILTSETSYFNSLNILTDHFIPKICKDNFLSPEDQKILFGNINSVKKISEKLLNDLEKSWNESIFLTDICDIIKKYSDKYFSCYVDYCANQGLSDTILRKCRVEPTPKNGKSPQLTRFGQAIRDLETNTNCQGLSLHSFLMLPMQRVTRLPLLVDAVLRRLGPQDDEYISCQGALRSLQDLVAKCNEAARQTERILELKRLKRQLEFPIGMSTVDLFEDGSKRFLVKSGDLIQLVAKGGPKTNEEGIKLTFGKRFQKISLTIFLFEDWIIIGKKKNEEYFNVLHHCPRSFLELSPADGQQLTIDSSLLLFLTLLENQDGKEISFLFSCASETERERWVEALCPTKIEDPNEVIYESWDCPQVQAIHHYEAQQPDELNLKRGDVVNVDRKMADQWFHGQKITDGQIGWFPGNFCVEVANPHLRARNLRQRYRLLALTDEFLNNSQNKT